MMRRYLMMLAAMVLWAIPVGAVDRPNVILVMTDDQGYGDLACLGNPVVRTPHLDQLHRESVRFTNFHVDPTCSPTRGALLTGKYAHRAKVWHTIAGGNHLRAGEMTMADAFKATGYRTGMFGKWHLGGNYPYRPMDRGFDEWLGQGDGGTGTTDDFFTNDRVNDVYLHNGEREPRKGFAPDVFFEAAMDFIRQPAREKPFFVYLCTYLPHHPHTVPDVAWTEPIKARGVDAWASYFYAGIERIDHLLGRLRKTLDEEGLADSTILIFMTDNGGTGGVKIFNAGMRGKKGSVYEGGHRVPFFLHWPAGKLRHGADVDDLTAHIDVLPTLVDLCRLTLPAPVDFDGRSFRTHLFKPGTSLPPRALCVELQRTFTPAKWAKSAVMAGRWRLVNGKELYNLDQDPGQVVDVAADHPEVVDQLKRDFEAYWKRVRPGDRDRATVVLGHPDDPETYLHSSDWYLPNVPWNHQHVSRGAKQAGDWRITVAEAGTYQFVVRRWPKEVDAPIVGVPAGGHPVDAWDPGGGKPHLIYAATKPPYQALSVASVRLQVGSFEQVKSVGPEDEELRFELPLEAVDYDVKAELLDAQNRVIAGAYYVYCRKDEG